MSRKTPSSTPRPSERKAARAGEQQQELPTPLRKYYLAAAAFFFVGDILAVSTESALSVVVFTILTLMMLWIAWRVDRLIENRRPSDRTSARDRPY